MPGPPDPDADDDAASPHAWPWRCLGCGGTIYHDGERCRDCRRSDRAGAAGRHRDSPEGFVDWMRRQPASTLSLKVSVVAGVELSLTAAWLQLLLGASGLAGVVPPVP